MTILDERGKLQRDAARAHASILHESADRGIRLLDLCESTGPWRESKRGKHTQTISPRSSWNRFVDLHLESLGGPRLGFQTLQIGDHIFDLLSVQKSLARKRTGHSSQPIGPKVGRHDCFRIQPTGIHDARSQFSRRKALRDPR
jgi:hypothetical protein